jgi:hypothetical protein
MSRKIENGEIYVGVTLFGGQPDCNRRMVYRWPDDVPICTMNFWMRPWTANEESDLKVIVEALKARHSSRRE